MSLLCFQMWKTVRRGTFLALPYIMPMLESVDSIMKFALSNNVFVADYVAAFRICQPNLYMMYSDDATAWSQSHFGMFFDIVNNNFYAIAHE